MLNLSLFTTFSNEKEVFDALQPAFSIVLSRNNVNPNKLELKIGKTYSSVWFDTQMAFRICFHQEQCYFSISSIYEQYIPEHLATYVITNQRTKGFINLGFEPTLDQLGLFSDFLTQILERAIDTIPKQFDCCSRYEECSNAKRCIHPNPDMAEVCGYRKILKEGKIYYGRNRNT